MGMTRAGVSMSRIAQLTVVLVAMAMLAACTSVPVMGPGPPPLVGAKKTKTLGPAPLKGEAASFAFTTVSGIPADFRFALEKSLNTYATSRNLAIVAEDDTTAAYHVRGYLSAVGDQSGTLLIYTWDVTDVAGTPLYRISGQETAAGSATDPWLGISNDQIDAAARDTIDKLADWVRG
jgi:hypothetical protein